MESPPAGMSLSWRIVRNLISRNLRPRRPTRSWMKKTGPRDSSLMAIAMAAMNGAASSRAVSAIITDSTRLTTSDSGRTRKPSPKISALGVSDSTARRPVRRSNTRVPSSTTTPRKRQASSSETGRLPRRSGIATTMRSGRTRRTTSPTSP